MHVHGDTRDNADTGDDTRSNNESRTLWAAALTGSFMLAEVVGGLLSGSLALLADAGHMLTDFASLTLAWVAFRLSRRPADAARTYGFDRIQVLVAFLNGLALFLIAGWILVEAAHRLLDPMPVLGSIMAGVAALGLLVNIGAFLILHGADRDNLNIRGATLHVLGDLFGSVAALLGAGVILLTGWTPIDPLLSVLVAVLVLWSAWRLVAEAGHILLEGTPKGLDLAAVGPDLVAHVGPVESVHHVHAWSITQERQMITLHACVADDGRKPEAVTAAIKARLSERFGITHATIELEHSGCADAAACGGRRAVAEPSEQAKRMGHQIAR